MSNLKGFVDFGIKPSTTYAAAGYDFYIPNLKTKEQKEKALIAFKQSYNLTGEEISDILNEIKKHLENVEMAENVLMLYLALDTNNLKSEILTDRISEFFDKYVVIDLDKQVPGIMAQLNDHIKINSGVKVALEPNQAGIFYNKSGMGTRGWDVRACVVDEDYSGYVHLSGAYTKNSKTGGTFYAGDKFSQMVIEIINRGDDFDTIDEETYNDLMKDSKRGSKAMGSSDVKH
jgi:dUTPase